MFSFDHPPPPPPVFFRLTLVYDKCITYFGCHSTLMIPALLCVERSGIYMRCGSRDECDKNQDSFLHLVQINGHWNSI
jgi:hypothetical protein